MRSFLIMSGLLLGSTLTSAVNAAPIIVQSPNNEIALHFELRDSPRQTSGMFYSVRYKGREIVAPSRLGLHLQNALPLRQNMEVKRITTQKYNRSWKPLYGERNNIPDNYRQASIELQEKSAPSRRLQVLVRAYNEGVALRYVLPKQTGLENFVIEREETQFRFPSGSFGYEEYGTEGEYQRVRVEDIRANCEYPLTVEVAGGGFASIIESHVENYSRMLLSSATDEAANSKETPTLVSALRGPVTATAPFSTPWRAMVVGDDAGDLLERNYLMLNLNPPSALQNTSWIKPGKVIREVTLSTEGGKACVDFAVARKLSYIELDAGWYGHEYDDKSDATTVSVDPKRNPKNDLDLPAVIEYARQKNIGVLLYVNRRALERQLDEVLPLYQKWGVKGIKFGFVNVGPQKWTDWLNDAIAKAARYEMVIDVHDGYRPTGLSRTYPNLLTQEGVRGNEHMPTARHNVTLPFTRGVAGAADYTICYYTDRIKTTRAHQLALAVAMYSPLQFLYWYDRPASYKGEAEIAFFDAVPTVWDDTQVLAGNIGEFAAIARRSGDSWYLGCLTGDGARELKLPLRFLKPNTKYTAHIYSDADVSGKSPKQVRTSQMAVDANSVLDVSMAPTGGQAIRIVPTNAK